MQYYSFGFPASPISALAQSAENRTYGIRKIPPWHNHRAPTCYLLTQISVENIARQHRTAPAQMRSVDHYATVGGTTFASDCPLRPIAHCAPPIPSACADSPESDHQQRLGCAQWKSVATAGAGQFPSVDVAWVADAVQADLISGKAFHRKTRGSS